jgi:PAS domain S-box-containing protein
LKDTDSVVGIYEVLDPATTISVAAKINPGIKKIYVIYDNSRSGIDSKDLIVDALKESRYEIRYLNMFTINQIMNEVSKLDDDSIVLLGAYHSDVNGYTIPADKFSELISRASSVPVYDLQDYRLGNGVLGGCLLTGNETGRNAAELGIRLLKGESIHEMENSDKHLTACVFDYQQLERFKIPLDILPQGSTIINKPFSFFETYKTLVIGTIILIATLSIFIVLLLWHIGRRRRAELAANQANEELKALYEQLYAIDEQLKFQLTELSAAHENLRLSEEKYRLVAEATNDIIWDWNAENGQIHYSGGLKEMLGYEPTEIEDREAWSRIVLEEDQDSVTRAVIESIKNRKDLSMIEYRVKHKNGDIV